MTDPKPRELSLDETRLVNGAGARQIGLAPMEIRLERSYENIFGWYGGADQLVRH